MSDDKMTRFDLGDAGGDNERLRNSREELAEQLNEDSTDLAPIRKLDLLSLVRSQCWSPIAKFCVKTFEFLRDRLTSYNERNANAKKTLSEAAMNLAEAAVIRKQGDADYKLKLAEVESVTVQTEIVRTTAQVELIEKLQKLGIDWVADQDEDGHLQIVVTKKPRDDDAEPKRLE